MPRDLMRSYRIEQLGVDAGAIRKFGDKIEMLLADLRTEATLAQDAATGEAMVLLASDLRDAAHGPFSAMMAAHDAACDAEGIEPIYQPDASVCLSLGIKIEAPRTKAQLQAAVDEIARRLAPKAAA